MDHDAAEERFGGPESGPTWAERAQLASLRAVIDPADTDGGKNRLIDRVHKHALRRAAGDLRGKAVLDFGCGTGRLSDWLAKHGAQTDGVDVTPQMVAAARENVPGGRFQTIDGRTLPFRDDCFDLVVSAAVLQYHVGDRAIPRELARVMRSGGRLIAIEQVTENGLGRGGATDAYAAMFTGAGFSVLEASIIRVSDSRIMRLAQRFAPLSRLPGIPWIATVEAARAADRPLVDGRYADFVFVAVKP